MSHIYDVAVIGGGVSGTAAAYRLSRYKLKTVLLEKESDVSFGVSKANSGIVHGGFHYSAEKTLKGKLEIKGNLMYDKWHEELDFAFNRCGNPGINPDQQGKDHCYKTLKYQHPRR